MKNKLIKILTNNYSQRKFRLFLCAYVRQDWHSLHNNCKQAVIVAEKFADRLSDSKELGEAWSNAWIVDRSQNLALNACSFDPKSHVMQMIWFTILKDFDILLEEIFDTFNKIQKPKTNETIIHFANEIYNNTNENGFFNSKDLGILADMLYDEGYDNDHLRNGKHVRGCQLIDLILGKK